MYYEQLQIHTNPVFWICESIFCSKDSFLGFVSSYCVLKIRFVDSIRRPVFKRFISWIRFVRPKISKYSIDFDLEGFVYESRKLNQMSFHILVIMIYQPGYPALIRIFLKSFQGVHEVFPFWTFSFYIVHFLSNLFLHGIPTRIKRGYKVLWNLLLVPWITSNK